MDHISSQYLRILKSIYLPATEYPHTHKLKVIFYPDYSHAPLEKEIDLTIYRVTPTIYWPPIAPIYINQPLTYQQLNAGFEKDGPSSGSSSSTFTTRGLHASSMIRYWCVQLNGWVTVGTTFPTAGSHRINYLIIVISYCSGIIVISSYSSHRIHIVVIS